MAFSRERIRYVNADEINELLSVVRDMCDNIYYRKKDKNEPFAQNAFIEDCKTILKVSFCKGLKPCTYIFAKDNSDPKHYVAPIECWRTVNRYAKVQRVDTDAPKGVVPYDDEFNCLRVGSAKALLYKNEKYAGKRVKAYCYDLNSAYAMMLKQPIPDIRTLKADEFLKEGQIGFIERAEGELTITFEAGKYCDYTCDLMESPYKKFVEIWYERKRNAKNKIEKSKAKDYLNFPVGYAQNINPFLRACVVGRCNLYMKSLMDENTIYSNTDSIVSLVRRPDLEENMGLEVGQWKFEHNGEMFAWAKDKINYQWNDDIPVVRGISKQWFKTFEVVNGRKWDILIDENPVPGNLYRFNKETLEIEVIDYE